MTEVLRYAAFTGDPEGGNPAGVVLDATGLDAADMAAIAAEVGYSETAFVTPGEGDALAVRYFSPESEVPFCGHATIATAVALADRGRGGRLHLDTAAGRVAVSVADTGDGPVATLTSVAPHAELADVRDVAEALDALGWAAGELDPELPPALAFAGARHLVLGVRTRERLADLDYDFDALRALLERLGCVTLALVHRRPDGRTFDVRNPVPTGGVVEDPATGAAAAALGALLRDRGLVDPPVRLTLHQGDDMGRPSLLLVDVPAGDGGIAVSGRAVPIP
jgi:PhzF family phenazine biosynthesis protein